jgi:hypothetical protein
MQSSMLNSSSDSFCQSRPEESRVLRELRAVKTLLPEVLKALDPFVLVEL